jgi:hypothetical protein
MFLRSRCLAMGRRTTLANSTTPAAAAPSLANPAPQRTPIAAEHQSVAAVFSPLIDNWPRRRSLQATRSQGLLVAPLKDALVVRFFCERVCEPWP